MFQVNRAEAGQEPAFALSAQQTIIFVVIFAAVKKIRDISPVISALLIMLMLSGSFGFTLIHHTCFHCGTNETVAAIAADQAEPGCCCREECDILHRHSTGEPELSDDCCTHETERFVTDELVRFEVQHEILPYFMAATIVAVVEECPDAGVLPFAGEKPRHSGPGLTTMHCRIQS